MRKLTIFCNIMATVPEKVGIFYCRYDEINPQSLIIIFQNLFTSNYNYSNCFKIIITITVYISLNSSEIYHLTFVRYVTFYIHRNFGRWKSRNKNLEDGSHGII